MLTAKNTQSNISKLEAGVYTARCIGLVDEGEQLNEQFQKTSRKVRIVWALMTEMVQGQDGEQHYRTISNEYTLSLSDRSTLKKDLQAWRGKNFTEEELNGFDLNKILGQPCQLQIIDEVSKKNGATYSKISAIMSMPKGMKVEELSSTYVLDFDDERTYINYLAVPPFVRTRIKSATNFEGSKLQAWIAENIDESDTDTDTAEKTETTTSDFKLEETDLF